MSVQINKVLFKAIKYCLIMYYWCPESRINPLSAVGDLENLEPNV